MGQSYSGVYGTPANGAGAAAVPPIPLDLPDKLPRFPVGALPSVLREWVREEAEATQTPADLAAALALAAVAAAAGGRYVVEGKQGWKEPLNIFMLVTLPPGERKSQVFRDAIAPLQDFESSETKRLESQVRDAQVAYEILDGRCKRAIRKASGAHATSADTVLAVRLAEELQALNVPGFPRYLTNDVTPEKLAALMEANDERMAIMSPEGGIFEIMAGRYTDASNLDIFLMGHAGDRHQTDRIGRPPVVLHNPVLTIGLAVQPNVLDGLGSRPDFSGRGLLARFAYILPTSFIGSRRIGSPPVTDGVKRTYEYAVRRILLEAVPEAPKVLGLTPEASELFHDYQLRIEPRLGPDGDLISDSNLP